MLQAICMLLQIICLAVKRRHKPRKSLQHLTSTTFIREEQRSTLGQDTHAEIIPWFPLFLQKIVFFFFHWHYSPLWALACRTMSFHFFLSATNSFHLLTPSTWRSLSTSFFHLFLGLPLLVPFSSWVKIFLGILPSSILSRWPNQHILTANSRVCIWIGKRFLSSASFPIHVLS